MNPYDKARELKEALEKHHISKIFKDARAKLETDESAKKMVDDFREKQMELQHQEALGKKIDESQQKKMQELYAIILMNKVAAEYMNAEFNYARLMQDITEILAETAE